ncbi:hypothetical protein SAMN05421538_101288 [Paracoccus isoporae]|uniref:HTH cro/C1-type domain-containing protein n=1 Tax=Paracoccus isoporae TaxID=591205 RepID=A0A1G6TIJ0_9RHOB|nr:helix-turn-helix transcriptional regulator [Paracoccus isoporae]SDD28684.1 hypothetical protein SAMN05421538_101288 [Paracoccus isoporae]
MSQPSTPHRVTAGARIRERRLSLGLTQADLARRAGISPAYMNLIEHDRRNLTGHVRAGLADALGISEAELEAGREEALLHGLRVAAARDVPAEIAIETERMAEFATRLPGWAGLVVALSERAEAQARRLTDLSDRMTQNPYLLDTVHEVLSAITSLRSTASILVKEPQMDAAWRERFHGNLDQDSLRLSVTAQALVAYLDSFEQDAGLMTPQEEFETWIAEGRPDGGPASDAARALAESWAEAEAADRLRLPDQVLAPLLGGDPFALAARTGVPLDLILRRLGLSEPGSGLMICDGAGGVTFRKAAGQQEAARPGDPCAMLPIFEALGQPGTPLQRIIETETGDLLEATAVATRMPADHPGGTVLGRAVMLLRPAAEPEPPFVPVGPTCRICPRQGCKARRVPSILLAGA